MDMADIREIATAVLQIQRESRKLPSEELNEVLHFDRMKDRIFYRLGEDTTRGLDGSFACILSEDS